MDVEDLRGVDSNPDYVTILPAIHDKACVAIMRWGYTDKEYVIHKCSRAITKVAAESLARSWAAALKVEIR
jgi:hypothetical protein